MGFIDIHVHGLDETDLSLFRWDFSKRGAEDGRDEADVASPPVETDEGAPVGTDESTSRSPKAAALGFLVVLGFLVATGLLVKRKLGGGSEDAPIDEREDSDA